MITRRRHDRVRDTDTDKDTATDAEMCMHVRELRTAVGMSHTVYSRR